MYFNVSMKKEASKQLWIDMGLKTTKTIDKFYFGCKMQWMCVSVWNTYFYPALDFVLILRDKLQNGPWQIKLLNEYMNSYETKNILLIQYNILSNKS